MSLQVVFSMFSYRLKEFFVFVSQLNRKRRKEDFKNIKLSCKGETIFREMGTILKYFSIRKFDENYCETLRMKHFILARYL